MASKLEIIPRPKIRKLDILGLKFKVFVRVKRGIPIIELQVMLAIKFVIKNKYNTLFLLKYLIASLISTALSFFSSISKFIIIINAINVNIRFYDFFFCI